MVDVMPPPDDASEAAVTNAIVALVQECDHVPYLARPSRRKLVMIFAVEQVAGRFSASRTDSYLPADVRATFPHDARQPATLVLVTSRTKRRLGITAAKAAVDWDRALMPFRFDTMSAF